MIEIDLKGRVALVIGGSRGIGGATTKTLCQAGALTIFTHTGNPKYRAKVEALLQEISESGRFAKATILDARDSAKTTSLVKSIIKEHGRIDILVCSAGKNVARPAEELTDEEWKEDLNINISSSFYNVRAVLPHMVGARYGRIILIGSSAVYDGGGGAIGYAASKSALTGMMMYLNRNYARKGILTNIIHPSVIDTDLLRERYSDEEKRRRLIEQIPAGRLGKPEDIARLVACLASPLGDFVCGQSILLDGGRTFFKRS